MWGKNHSSNNSHNSFISNIDDNYGIGIVSYSIPSMLTYTILSISLKYSTNLILSNIWYGKKGWEMVEEVNRM